MDEMLLPTYYFPNVSNWPLFDIKKEVWEPLTRIEKYIKELFASGYLQENYPKAKLVFVGKNTIIEEGVLIQGPAIIGDNCVIRHGAYLRENCIIGNDVVIGHGSEIKNSIIMANSAIAHFNYVGDSIIGEHVNMGGGAKIANSRLDAKEVAVRVGDKKVSTGLAKFGAIVGNDTKIGVNAVLNPGTLLGQDVKVYPLCVATGSHMSHTVIK